MLALHVSLPPFSFSLILGYLNMGMNFYWHPESKACPHCGHDSVEIRHIGKASFGWTFSFHGYLDIKSYKHWREEFTRSGVIKDEYGKIYTPNEFDTIVQANKGGKSHALLYPEGCWIDEEGYDMLDHEFS